MAGPVLRVARPCSDLGHARRFYCGGLGLTVLAEFSGHDGFDGLIVGEPAAGWHLELIVARGAAMTAPSPEDLIVLYEPEPSAFDARVLRLRAAGFEAVRSTNPYWDRHGVTFADTDGFRTVIANLAWMA